MKKTIYKILQYLVVIICLSLIAKIILDEQEISKILFSVNFYKFLPSIILSIFITLFFSQLIYRVLLQTTQINISTRKWLYIFLNSQFLDTIPFAGFFYKALRLKKYNLDFKYFLYSYFFILVAWMILYLSLFFIDINLISILIKDIIYFYISLLFLISSVFVFITIIFLSNYLKKLNFKRYILLQLKELISFVKLNILKKENISTFIKYGVLIHIFEFILYLVVINFLELNIDIQTILIIFIVNSVVDFFPITPKNIGFSELISGGLLNIIGFSFTTGVLIKIFVRFSSILSTTVLFFINILINDKE